MTVPNRSTLEPIEHTLTCDQPAVPEVLGRAVSVWEVFSHEKSVFRVCRKRWTLKGRVKERDYLNNHCFLADASIDFSF